VQFSFPDRQTEVDVEGASLDARMEQPPEAPSGATDRAVPLAMPAEEFRRVGHELVDTIAGFLATLPQRPLTPAMDPDQLRTLLHADEPLPETGSDAGALMRQTADRLIRSSLFNGHPRFFGYVTSSPAHIGMLGDLLAAAINPNVGAWTLAPAATEIEAQTIRWIAELIGYPIDCGGILVSGGNMANFIGILAARASVGDRDVRVDGVQPASLPPLRLYASTETHTWVQKAADLFGMGTDSIRWIPTDDEGRMDVDRLVERVRQDREAGDRPFFVAGTAGSVSTGAVDPLREISAVCRAHDLWFHVDGAYGGLAAAVPECAPGLEALALADSVAVDPHKWLYAPLEAGCALVRDPEKLRAAFSYHPPYYHFDRELTNYVDFGPQNSRGFRALKVWLALRQAGREGYRQMIGDDIRLAERLLRNVDAHADLEAKGRGLSIVTFRYLPVRLASLRRSPEGEQRLDELNQRILDRIQRSGEAFVSQAVIAGHFFLRACIVNFNTRAADVDALPEIVARLGRECEAEWSADAGVAR
jgi:glutamate/tyrosine decarboxylase-like PLP-dependent enzyme